MHPQDALCFAGINTWRGVTVHPPILTGKSYLRIGTVEVGKVADLVALDPATITETGLERVWDFPGNGDRLISRNIGIEHIWVGGTAIRRNGVEVPDVSPGVLVSNIASAAVGRS